MNNIPTEKRKPGPFCGLTMVGMMLAAFAGVLFV